MFYGKPRVKTPEEIAKADEEEHEKLDVIRRADEYRDEMRRRTLVSQENPFMEEWEEAPRYALA
jgi:hypothetical protein